MSQSATPSRWAWSGERLPNIGSYEIRFDYDPARLSLVGISDAGFLGATGRSVFCPPPLVHEPGDVQFGCASAGATPSGPSGTGTLATIVFEATAPGSTDVRISDASVSDELGDVVTPLSFFSTGSASIRVASVYPTLTATPEGATPVLNAIALNSNTCAWLGFKLEQTDSSCHSLDTQMILQRFARCLREVAVNGIKACDFSPQLLLDITAEDFKNIDLDLNQIHANLRLIIVAFVTEEGPVTFQTTKGAFERNLSSAISCTLPFSTGPNIGDPDCDGDASTQGDGVVGAYLEIGETVERGPGVVQVSSGGEQFEIDFDVTGIPASVEIEGVTGITTLVRGSSDCPYPTDVTAIRELAESGLPPDPQRTSFVVRVRDSDGQLLAGARMNWRLDTPLGIDRLNIGVGDITTMDLGSAGIGLPQIACSGPETGPVTLQPFVSGYGVSAFVPFQIVEDFTPTATSTPTPSVTATPEETPTGTPTPIETSTPTPTASAPHQSPTPQPDQTPTSLATTSPVTTQTAVATPTPAASATAGGDGTTTPTPTADSTETAASETPKPEETPTPGEEKPTETATPDLTKPSETPESTGTPGFVPPTATPGQQTATNTSVATATNTAVIKTQTPAATTSTPDSGTTPAVTSSPGTGAAADGTLTQVNEVMGVINDDGPTGIVLPVTGTGGDETNSTRGLSVASALAAAGLVISLAAARRRRRIR